MKKFKLCFTLFFLIICVASILPANTVFGASSIMREAEDTINNTIPNSASRIRTDTNCSGQKFVGSTSGTDDITFKNLVVDTAGTYNLTVNYKSGELRTCNVSVNAGTAVNFSFPSLGNWSTIGSVTYQISLLASGNTIRFYNTTGWAPDFDNILLALVPVNGTTIITDYLVESAHPYTNNLYEPKNINFAFAKRIRAHFSYINTESGYDSVSTSGNGLWSGSYSDIWSPWTIGSEMSVCLSTDSSVTSNGYKIDKIEYEPTDSFSEVVNDIDSPHNYSNNYNNTWTIKCAGANGIRVHFSSIQTESNYDYVRTSSGNSWSGNYNDVWSNWVNGDTITVNLTTDGSVTAWGLKIDSIETKSLYSDLN